MENGMQKIFEGFASLAEASKECDSCEELRFELENLKTSRNFSFADSIATLESYGMDARIFVKKFAKEVEEAIDMRSTFLYDNFGRDESHDKWTEDIDLFEELTN